MPTSRPDLPYIWETYKGKQYRVYFQPTPSDTVISCKQCGNPVTICYWQVEKIWVENLWPSDAAEVTEEVEEKIRRRVERRRYMRCPTCAEEHKDDGQNAQEDTADED